MGSSSGGGSMPQFDAAATARQQTTSNVQTGIANALLGNTNQVTPYGNLNYTQTGTTDVGGNQVPSFTATQTLSPEQQAIYDKTTGLQTGALDTAGQLLPKVSGAINTPLDFSGLAKMPTDLQGAKDTAYNALMDRSRIDLGRSRDAQQVQLQNQGISQGSEAWKRAMEGQDRALVDASNQATLQSGNVAAQDVSTAQALRNQGITETQTLRNQPLVDYQTLLGLSGGVTQPTYAPSTQAQIPMTDVSSPAMAAYQGQVQGWQNQQNANNSMMGGLFGLGGSVLGGLARFAPMAFMPSDARLKENIRRIGTADNGVTLYVYNFKGDPRAQVGVMAQEVEASHPGAVVEIGGIKHVDYAAVFDGR